MYREYRDSSNQRDISVMEPTKTVHQAASDGDITTLALLLGEAKLVERDSSGATPLYRAAEHGHAAAVGLLLTSGAHVNARKRHRWTPLHIAARNNHVSVMAELIESAADINRKTNRGMTPIMLCAKHQHLEGVKFLTGRKCDVNEEDMFGRSALQWAIKGGSREIVEELVSAEADLSKTDTFRKTPIIQCVKSDRPDILKYLLGLGLDHTSEEKRYRAPIHMAVVKGRPECLDILLEHGISPNARSSNFRTPLQIAACEVRYRVTQMLLDYGADLNTKDNHGTTPLHELALSSRLPPRRGKKDRPFCETALLLIDANIDLDALSSARAFRWKPNDANNLNALEVATKSGRSLPLIQLLARAGTCPNRLYELFDSDPQDLVPSLRNNPATMNWLRCFYEKPRSLKEHCRKVVRTSIGVSFKEKLSTLALPKYICEYLHYSDLRPAGDNREFDGSTEPDQYECDANSECDYNASVFDSDYGDDPNIVDTD